MRAPDSMKPVRLRMALRCSSRSRLATDVLREAPGLSACGQQQGVRISQVFLLCQKERFPPFARKKGKVVNVIAASGCFTTDFQGRAVKFGCGFEGRGGKYGSQVVPRGGEGRRWWPCLGAPLHRPGAVFEMPSWGC